MRIVYYIFYFLFFGWFIGLVFRFFSFSRFLETIKKQPKSLNLFQFAGAASVVVLYYLFSFNTAVLFLAFSIFGQLLFIALLPYPYGE